MRKPGGYAVIVSPTESVAQFDRLRREQLHAGANEMDTFSCGHCGGVVHVPARADPANLGGLCKQCMRLICPRCLDRGCEPLERKLERAEERDRTLRSYGL